MRIAVYGSWVDSASPWKTEGERKDFENTCSRIGAWLARARHQLIVTSEKPTTADHHATRGYLDYRREHPGAPCPPAILLFTDRNQRQFCDLAESYRGWFTLKDVRPQVRFDRHLAGVRLANAVIAVGGADHTYAAGQVARFARKPLAPLGRFGGASRVLLTSISDANQACNQELLSILWTSWSEESETAVAKLLGLEVWPKVLIVHGRSTDWESLRDVLLRVGFSPPIVLRDEIRGGDLLPERWEEVADRADAAVVVITPDDEGRLVEGNEPLRRRARENVWVEVGWLWRQLGRKNVLLLVRDGDDPTELPSDVRSVVPLRYKDISDPAVADGLGKFLKEIRG